MKKERTRPKKPELKTEKHLNNLHKKWIKCFSKVDETVDLKLCSERRVVCFRCSRVSCRVVSCALGACVVCLVCLLCLFCFCFVLVIGGGKKRWRTRAWCAWCWRPASERGCGPRWRAIRSTDIWPTRPSLSCPSPRFATHTLQKNKKQQKKNKKKERAHLLFCLFQSFCF